MAEVRVGVMGSADVQGPLAGGAPTKWGLDQPSTWALIFFICAILYLVVL